jgi:hypothetical protein
MMLGIDELEPIQLETNIEIATRVYDGVLCKYCYQLNGVQFQKEGTLDGLPPTREHQANLSLFSFVNLWRAIFQLRLEIA